MEGGRQERIGRAKRMNREAGTRTRRWRCA
jgi:hypothetical protein